MSNTALRNQWRILRCNLRAHFMPYRYENTLYPDSFLAANPKVVENRQDTVPEQIYVFWTGNNPLTENRIRNLAQLKKTVGVPIILVTPENLSEYILPESPLHPAYKYLSLIQKSDYLRCYFMHHFGGGYADIKAYLHSWLPMFKRLNTSSAYLIGYPEKQKTDLSIYGYSQQLQRDAHRYFSKLAGNGAYICRPNTPFTREWYTEMLYRMDYYAPELAKHPGDTFGNNPGYPIPWGNLAGNICHPLGLKYMDKILLDKLLYPICENYR